MASCCQFTRDQLDRVGMSGLIPEIDYEIIQITKQGLQCDTSSFPLNTLVRLVPRVLHLTCCGLL